MFIVFLFLLVSCNETKYTLTIDANGGLIDGKHARLTVTGLIAGLDRLGFDFIFFAHKKTFFRKQIDYPLLYHRSWDLSMEKRCFSPISRILWAVILQGATSAVGVCRFVKFAQNVQINNKFHYNHLCTLLQNLARIKRNETKNVVLRNFV